MLKQNLIVLCGTIATLAVATATLSAQTQNPRFGKWKLKSEAPAPSSNIMTYEPGPDGKGMKENATTSVRTIDHRINEIINTRNGRVTQILTNVLSPDGNTIGIIYMRMDPEGKKTTNVTSATYERMP